MRLGFRGHTQKRKEIDRNCEFKLPSRAFGRKAAAAPPLTEAKLWHTKAEAQYASDSLMWFTNIMLDQMRY